MNKLIKLAIIASVAAFFGCSGEGTVSSRADVVPDTELDKADQNIKSSSSISDDDEGDEKSSSSRRDDDDDDRDDRDDDDVEGPIVSENGACMYAGIACFPDMPSYDCDEEDGGEFMESCPKKDAKKCNVENTDFFIYTDILSCEDLYD